MCCCCANAKWKREEVPDHKVSELSCLRRVPLVSRPASQRTTARHSAVTSIETNTDTL